MPFVESIQEFTQRMGCTPLHVRNRFLYPNGGQSNGHEHIDPPQDPIDLLRLRREYVVENLFQREKRYEAERGGIAEQLRYHGMGWGPMPPEGWEAYLEELTAEIEKLREELAKIDQEFRAVSPPHVAAQVRDEQKLEQQQRSMGALRRLQKFKV